jgi:predicted RecB family nuclease
MKIIAGGVQLTASDLANYLACRHLTQLDKKVASGVLIEPSWRDPSLAILRERGQRHEDSYIEFLKRGGLSIANLKGQPRDATLESMKKGIDVIVQATVGDEIWVGRVDILRRVTLPSSLGNWSYEVEDTKLAMDTRTSTILQLCLYTEYVAALQGLMPTRMYVVKPGNNFPKEDFLVSDFQAYFRFARQQLVQTIGETVQVQTYPDPVSHCDICRWWKECDIKRHNDDHLSLIAGIRSLHIGELQRQGIMTLEAFAERAEPLKEKPERGNKETFAKAHAQAGIQLKGRNENKLTYKLLVSQPGRGLSRLPVPSEGDVYFDIEGNPFFPDGGIEYLLGYVSKDKNGMLRYHRQWASDRPTEKAAFEAFIDFVMTQWKNDPNMYIYHYSPYEPGAVKRLAGRHGTREIDVDKLLRGERFVDLYAASREGLIASVEHYSLKDLEKFASYERKVDLSIANAARFRVDCSLELGLQAGILDEDRRTVEEYNYDDCMATAALHDWLEGRRSELEATTHSLQRPENKSGEASGNLEERQGEIQALFDRLVAGLPEERSSWDEEEKARWLLAHMLEYFWREFRCACWEYFRVHDLDYDDLLDERKAIAGLKFLSIVGTAGKSFIHRYSYPPQEIGINIDDDLYEVKGDRIGRVSAIDQLSHTIDIKKTSAAVAIHPTAIHIDELIRSDVLASSLLQLARSIIENGITGKKRYRAATDLLMKRSPRLTDGVLAAKSGEDVQHAAIRIAGSLDESCLAIQGPPGTGKTFTGGYLIASLAASGKRIGVTAVSHKVIRNLLDSALKAANRINSPLKVVHKVSEKSEDVPVGIEEVTDNKKALQSLGDGKVVGGTAWLWARDEAGEELDYLFVDEAGQMSLAQVLAAARSAKNLILLGDPQQLEQPQKGAHPEGADIAALSHILDGHKTLPPERGLFLDTTWRLHPSICRFTSELYYENRLRPRDGLERQRIAGEIPFAGSGLFYVPVPHQGNQIKATEETTVIAEIVKQLLNPEVTWADAEGKTQCLKMDDILIVAPYNGQVAALRETLPGMRIGTVDKFQGQEAPVVIYSMTSSSSEDAPRGMNFLYSPNRFNVATSRAQCSVLLVGSPKLFEPECNTVDQMRWTNALCRYREMATVIDWAMP